MQHWDNVLPKKVLRVNNEDLISDLEGQVTRILTFLELPFEEECISFYKTERSVDCKFRTGKKACNKEGMGRWKPYKHLKPLLEVLDSNLLLEEDIELIKGQ